MVDSDWNVSGLAVSPDEHVLAVGKTKEHRGVAVSVELFDVATGQFLWTLDTGHVDHMCFLADNRALVTSGGGFLQEWDLSTHRVQRRWPLASFIS